MALTLAQIRENLKQKESKGSGGSGGKGGDTSIYRHWDMEEGQTSRLRFLPDADSSNPYFWVERAMIKLPFSGVKGRADSKPVTVQVPCIEMYPGHEGKCPILAEVRPWFKDAKLEELGRKYWKKKSYLFQGFVRQNNVKNDVTPDNPIRRFVISPQIFNLIKAALMDPDLEDLPVDYENGLDFLITKSQNGKYADYNSSVWARKATALTQDEAEAVEKFGLYDLKTFLPNMPGDAELKAMVEMFEASVDGQTYDLERWGSFYKPFGIDGAPADENSLPAATPVKAAKPAAPVVDEDEIDADDSPIVTPAAKPATGGASRVNDIMAAIRNRQQANS